MGAADPLSPEDISRETFEQLLARYPAVLQAVSDAKGVKPGQQSLAELDAFRYGEAPARFGLAGAEPLGLADVQTLVAWKLRHGKFRPTLMKLVSSNDDTAVREVVQEAWEIYGSEHSKQSEPSEDIKKALKVLCRLRGIGPATASLLLAVHDPQRVLFFADAAYAWLCGGPAWTMPQKYNEREYEDLSRRAAELLRRLQGGDEASLQAADIEKVAYVLLAEKKGKAESKPMQAETSQKQPAAKRKRADKPAEGSRRSQRIKEST